MKRPMLRKITDKRAALIVFLGSMASTSIVLYAQIPTDDSQPVVENLTLDKEVIEYPLQRETLTEVERRDYAIQASVALDLHETTVQQIDIVETERVKRIAITLNDQHRVLELYPYSLRSDDFVVLEQDATGALFEIPPPPITTFRGSIVGDNISDVAASVIDGKLKATILAHDGKWAVQPAGDSVARAPANLHAVYRSSDVNPPPGVCGVDDVLHAAQGGGGAAPGNITAAAGTGGRTQIAFDTDFEYYQANGSSSANTVSDVEMIMNQVGLIYQNAFDICYVLERVIVRTAEPDPYTATNSNSLLCQFRNRWNSNVTTTRDVAHLMTGKELDGTTIGVAWIGVVCNVQGFTTISGCTDTANLAYGLSQTFFSSNILSRTSLTAHELGHNWNCCHCNLSACTGGSADNDCGIMWSSAGAQQNSLAFGTRSSSSITNHRNSRGCLSTCTGSVYVDIDHVGTETGTISFPYNTLGEGIEWVELGGTVRIFSDTYPGFRTMTKFMNLEAHDGVVNIGD